MNKYEKSSKPYRTLNTKFLDKLLADESNTTLTEYDKIEQENIRLKESMSVDKIYDILDRVIYRQFQFKNKLMNDADIRNLAKELNNLTKQEG